MPEEEKPVQKPEPDTPPSKPEPAIRQIITQPTTDITLTKDNKPNIDSK